MLQQALEQVVMPVPTNEGTQNGYIPWKFRIIPVIIDIYLTDDFIICLFIGKLFHAESHEFLFSPMKATAFRKHLLLMAFQRG